MPIVAERLARERGPAPALTLAACAATGCDHPECGQAAAAHDRLPVHPGGSARRLQALAWSGHGVAVLAERLAATLAGRVAVDEAAIRRLQHGHCDAVPAALDAAIIGLFDALWDVPGESVPSATMAARYGWAPALAWDEPGDDTGHAIDDPAAVPAPGWQRRRLTVVERLADAAEVLPPRADRRALADRLGVSRSHADTLVSRARAAGGAW